MANTTAKEPSMIDKGISHLLARGMKEKFNYNKLRKCCSNTDRMVYIGCVLM